MVNFFCLKELCYVKIVHYFKKEFIFISNNYLQKYKVFKGLDFMNRLYQLICNDILLSIEKHYYIH